MNTSKNSHIIFNNKNSKLETLLLSNSKHQFSALKKIIQFQKLQYGKYRKECSKYNFKPPHTLLQYENQFEFYALKKLIDTHFNKYTENTEKKHNINLDKDHNLINDNPIINNVVLMKNGEINYYQSNKNMMRFLNSQINKLKQNKTE